MAKVPVVHRYSEVYDIWQKGNFAICSRVKLAFILTGKGPGAEWQLSGPASGIAAAALRSAWQTRLFKIWAA